MGSTALVIGGGSGIGAGVAQRLAEDGFGVVVADLDEAAATRVAATLPGPCAHRGAGVDVTDEASVAALLDAAVGPDEHLAVCVNTAGVSTLGAVTDLAPDEWRRVVDVCLTGGFLVIQAAARRMGPGGSIVSLTSLNARQPGAGLAPYCAAKAGLAMLTEVAALELGPAGIRVNAVSPGLVVTPLTAPAMDIPGIREDYEANTPLGRAGTVAEVAAAVSFLCSDQSSWMTGEVMDLNGGAHLMRYPDVMGHVVRMLEGS